jgi:hypothetical protein
MVHLNPRRPVRFNRMRVRRIFFCRAAFIIHRSRLIESCAPGTAPPRAAPSKSSAAPYPERVWATGRILLRCEKPRSSDLPSQAVEMSLVFLATERVKT